MWPSTAYGPRRSPPREQRIEGEYGDGLIWSAERITSENQDLREDAELAMLYMPFDPLLFFADAGNGDLFALLPRIHRPDVFVWNHEGRQPYLGGTEPGQVPRVVADGQIKL